MKRVVRIVHPLRGAPDYRRGLLGQSNLDPHLGQDRAAGKASGSYKLIRQPNLLAKRLLPRVAAEERQFREAECSADPHRAEFNHTV